jgi:putative sterol carrier protein
MPVKQLLEDTIARFHERVAKDEALQNELAGINKKVNVNLVTEKYHFVIDNKRVVDFGEGLLECPDIVIESDPQTVEDLFSGKMKIMKAWALRKIKVKGSMEDVMRLRKFF